MREFKGMVKALHRAGIEVILDVVYNHTAEGNHLGPMLAFRGVDNVSYYRLMPDEPRFYQDFTGTGNSLNPAHPSVLRLIMDSLRYFVIECHVDGFRFDLASALAREFYEVDRLSTFFDTIHQDPVLSQVKLIAEPWDVGPGGYQVGNFPVLWAEWNGHVPRHHARLLARQRQRRASSRRRFTGSSDLYQADGRDPFASINFVTAHDGFTLRDLVSYDEKHNEANGEANHDGTDDNRSWNYGVEGDTNDPGGRRAARAPAAQLPRHAASVAGRADAARRRRARPDAARQQQRLVPGQRAVVVRLGAARTRGLLDFVRRLIRLRREHPVFRRDDVPHRPRDARLRTARRLVVPAGRPADDAARLAAGRTGARSACSSTAPRSRLAPCTARSSATTRSCSSSTPTRSRCRSRSRRAASAPRWQLELATGEAPAEEFVAARAEVLVQGRSLVLLRRP